jgi:hypothetical protein
VNFFDGRGEPCRHARKASLLPAFEFGQKLFSGNFFGKTIGYRACAVR